MKCTVMKMKSGDYLTKPRVTTERNIRIHGLKLKKPHQSYNYIKNSNDQASRRRLLAAIIVFRNAKD